jgi:hypothetical protein
MAPLAGQVGHRARHLQRAVQAAARPAQAFGGAAQEARRGGVEHAQWVDARRLQLRVGQALALQLPLARRGHAGGHHGAGLAVGLRHQLAGFTASTSMRRSMRSSSGPDSLPW